MIIERIINVDQINPLSDIFAQNLLKELTQQNATIAVAEGCTGGKILNKITIPGATKVFRIGTIAYSRKAKEMLGVDSNLIDTHGEYSPEIAIEMAKKVRLLRNDTVGIATVGELRDNIYSTVYFASSLINGDISCVPITVKNEKRSGIKSVASNEALITSLNYINDRKEVFFDSRKGIQIIVDQEDDISEQNITLSKLLNKERLSISTIESCTGGAIGDAITDIPGSSNYFDSSWVVYDENSKVMLGVPLSTMAYGQVYSPQVSEEMAKALQKKTKTDVVISTTGTMDNWDTRPYHLDSPPGTVYYSIGIDDEIFTKRIQLLPQNRKIMKRELIKIIFNDIVFLITKRKENQFGSNPCLESSKQVKQLHFAL